MTRGYCRYPRGIWNHLHGDELRKSGKARHQTPLIWDRSSTELHPRSDCRGFPIDFPLTSSRKWGNVKWTWSGVSPQGDRQGDQTGSGTIAMAGFNSDVISDGIVLKPKTWGNERVKWFILLYISGRWIEVVCPPVMTVSQNTSWCGWKQPTPVVWSRAGLPNAGRRHSNVVGAVSKRASALHVVACVAVVGDRARMEQSRISRWRRHLAKAMWK